MSVSWLRWMHQWKGISRLMTTSESVNILAERLGQTRCSCAQMYNRTTRKTKNFGIIRVSDKQNCKKIGNYSA